MQQVILSDTRAPKDESERSHEPIFDVIVQFSKERKQSFDIIINIAEVIDRYLNGQSDKIQQRVFGPQQGVYVSFDTI